MVEITAILVKELRNRTDAPIMDCKSALAEAEGDITRAEEILRVRFGNKANKVTGRIAAEGVVAVSISSDRKIAAMLEVNSETDFCAKNQDFLNYVQKVIAKVIEESPQDINDLSNIKIGDKTIENLRTELIGKIGENISLRRFVKETAVGKWVSYIHGSKIGVLLDFVGNDETVAKDIAMHIAALKPKALSENEVDGQLIQAERRIAVEKAKESGKPIAMIDKIAEGSVQKYLKEVTLLNQLFVKNDKQTVAELLKQKGASIASFRLFIVGEGIEKQAIDFASEVAAMATRR